MEQSDRLNWIREGERRKLRESISSILYQVEVNLVSETSLVIYFVEVRS